MLGLYQGTTLNKPWRVAKVVIKTILPNCLFVYSFIQNEKEKSVIKYLSFRLKIFHGYTTNCQISSFIQVVHTEHLRNFIFRLSIKDESNYT